MRYWMNKDEHCSLSTYLLIGQPTNSKRKMFWCLPKKVFYCFLYWNSVNVVKWQLTGSRGDPGESLRQQACLRSRVAILQSSTVSAGPVYSLQLHCFDSTIYSLNRSTVSTVSTTVSTVSNSQCRFYKLQSQQVQSPVWPGTAQCCTVLFIRSSRVKEVWLAHWNSLGRRGDDICR